MRRHLTANLGDASHHADLAHAMRGFGFRRLSAGFEPRGVVS